MNRILSLFLFSLCICTDLWSSCTCICLQQDWEGCNWYDVNYPDPPDLPSEFGGHIDSGAKLMSSPYGHYNPGYAPYSGYASGSGGDCQGGSGCGYGGCHGNNMPQRNEGSSVNYTPGGNGVYYDYKNSVPCGNGGPCNNYPVNNAPCQPKGCENNQPGAKASCGGSAPCGVNAPGCCPPTFGGPAAYGGCNNECYNGGYGCNGYNGPTGYYCDACDQDWYNGNVGYGDEQAYDENCTWGSDAHWQPGYDRSFVDNPEVDPNVEYADPSYPNLYYRYEPVYYTTQKLVNEKRYCYKRQCRYQPQYYQKRCCVYVPQYYYATRCIYVPEYYYTTKEYDCPQYITVPRCKYVPRYYYKSMPQCGENCCACDNVRGF